jgi:UDP-N-acetylmuramate--alanine ligase
MYVGGNGMKDSINQIIKQRLSKMQKIHFVGVGGTGMSGIAEVMSNLGDLYKL